MKIKNTSHILTAAALSFLLSFGGIGCLVTAFELEVSMTVPVLCCALCAGVGCILFSFRRGGAAVLCILALLGGYLWQEGTLFQQLLRLCYDISHIYDRAYGWGWLGSFTAADSIVLPLCVWSGLTALITGSCISHRRFAPLTVLCAVLPLLLCLVVTDTIPSVLCLFTLLLGLILLLMTQNVRRRDAAQGARLTWLLTVPVALSLVLLFLSIPQSKYKSQDQLENIQDTVLEWVDKLPYIDISSDGEISLSLTKQISDTINLQSIGPNTQLGTRVMEVTAETSSRLYLRGRDYNIYTGTSWESTSGRSDTFSALSQSFLSTYDMDLFSAEELSIRTFGSHSVKYFPYYPAKAIRLVGGAFDNSSDSTAYSYQWYNLPSDYENYVTEHWHFLQEGNLDYITDDVLYGNTQILSSYYSSPFYNTARLYYLNLPDATADWAAEYLAEHLSISFEDSICTTANAIADLVRNSAYYNLDTPKMPGNRTDFAKWFLEDSDTGYCVHYATATTVLLRAAGIASRYVEGYMVNTQAGKTVTVTERDAHAWVEYYIENIGWVPLESTGSAAPEDEAFIPAVATDQVQPSNEATTPSPAAPEEGTDAAVSSTESLDSTQSRSEGKQPTTVSNPLVIILLLLTVLLAQYPVRLWLRQIYLRTGTANVRALKKWHFACRLAWLLHQAPPEELEELALRSKFSQHTLAEADLAVFDRFCSSAIKVLRRSPWWLQGYYRLFWAAY